MLTGVVAEAWPALFVLFRCSRRTFAAVLTDPKLWKLVLPALIEISYNYLYEDVGLSKLEAKQIFKHQKFLEQLSARGGLKSKKILVKNETLSSRIRGLLKS